MVDSSFGLASSFGVSSVGFPLALFLRPEVPDNVGYVSNRLEPPQPIRADIDKLWMLDPRIVFLNHGSFGAYVPRTVFETQTAWRGRIEAEPIEMLHRSAPQLHSNVKRTIAAAFGMAESDFGLVTNATEGINAVLRSIELRPGDELLTTTHVYNAVRQAMRYVAGRTAQRSGRSTFPHP